MIEPYRNALKPRVSGMTHAFPILNNYKLYLNFLKLKMKNENSNLFTCFVVKRTPGWNRFLSIFAFYII